MTETPRQLLVPTHANAGNDLELINDLQQLGWEVSKEHATDSQVVYNVYNKPEREIQANNMAPALRGDD